MRQFMALLLLPLVLALALTSWPVPVLALTLTLTPSLVKADTSWCRNRIELIDRLATKYGEVVAYKALNGRGWLIEIYVNPETGTWTLAITSVPGITCMIDSGSNWKGLLSPISALTSWQGVAVVGRCAGSRELREHLVATYGEVILYRAIDAGGQLIETYVNPKTGTWTIAVVYPYGRSCLLGSGTGWRGPLKTEEERRASAS